jgi:hypothetical protein
MTTKSIINGFINLRISFSDIVVDVVVSGHLAPKCVKKKKKDKGKKHMERRGKNIKHLICDKSKTLFVCVCFFFS